MLNHPGSLYAHEKIRRLNDQELARGELRRNLARAAREYAATTNAGDSERRPARFRIRAFRFSPR